MSMEFRFSESGSVGERRNTSDGTNPLRLDHVSAILDKRPSVAIPLEKGGNLGDAPISTRKSLQQEYRSLTEIDGLLNKIAEKGGIEKKLSIFKDGLLVTDKSEIDKLEEAAEKLPGNSEAADRLRNIIRRWADDAARSDDTLLHLDSQEVKKALDATKSLMHQTKIGDTDELTRSQQKVDLVSRILEEEVIPELLEEAIRELSGIGPIVRIASLIDSCVKLCKPMGRGMT